MARERCTAAAISGFRRARPGQILAAGNAEIQACRHADYIWVLIRALISEISGVPLGGRAANQRDVTSAKVRGRITFLRIHVQFENVVCLPLLSVIAGRVRVK